MSSLLKILLGVTVGLLVGGFGVSVLAAESPDPQVGPVVAPATPTADSPTTDATASPAPTDAPSAPATSAPAAPTSEPQNVVPGPQPVEDDDSDDHGGDDDGDDGDDDSGDDGDDDGDDD